MSDGPVRTAATAYRFPWRAGNHFELLPDADRYFPAMLGAIGTARRYILLEMYLFESGAVADRFIAALLDAVARDVRVYLLLDDFGTRGLSAADRERLARGGVQLAFYNPLHVRKWLANVARDHRKLLLIDGEMAFVGGAGLTDPFDPPEHPEQRWRDNMVGIWGPVLQDWQRLFLDTWNEHASQRLELPALAPGPHGVARGRVSVASGPAQQEVKSGLLRQIRASRYRVWLCTAYFIPSWKLRHALIRAARRGVDVRLLLPSLLTDHPAIHQAGRRYYQSLLHNGARIYEYQPRTLHAKVVLCDQWVSIGSSNFDRWTFHWNLEANQEVADRSFAGAVRAMLEADLGESREWRYEDWKQRPLYGRLRERLWGQVDLWLHRLSMRRRF